MKVIETRNAPTPAGHYSQAVIHNDVLYISGQLPIEPQTGDRVSGSIEAQTRQVLANVGAILEAAGSSRDKVLKATVYISDMSLWGEVNSVYAEFFGDHRPARAVVPTRELHHGFLIEMEAVAAV